MPFLDALEFVLFGVVVGTYGTLVGAGGGFLVVPALLLVYHATPQQAVGTSLVVIVFNALSGTIAYIRQRRIDYTTGRWFAVATVPGAILGTFLSSLFTSRFFSGLFGAFLILVAIFLSVRPELSTAPTNDDAPLHPGYVRREIVDDTGRHYVYSFSMARGMALSFVAGFLSSVLGIGGGLIHVPAMVFLFGFPAHIATATSHFVLLFTSLTGASLQLAAGHVLALPAVSIAIGIVVGAQLGAKVSRRLKGRTVIRVLSLALVIVGLRLVYGIVG